MIKCVTSVTEQIPILKEKKPQRPCWWTIIVAKNFYLAWDLPANFVPICLLKSCYSYCNKNLIDCAGSIAWHCRVKVCCTNGNDLAFNTLFSCLGWHTWHFFGHTLVHCVVVYCMKGSKWWCHAIWVTLLNCYHRIMWLY